jgi:hypothetical protein
LAFRSTIQEVLRSSAPAKMGEYLASGRPLLVHAPASTFIASHISAHNAGTVVDTPDPMLLASALNLMIERPGEITQTVENASRLAELYRASTARDAFRKLLCDVAIRRRMDSKVEPHLC